MRGSADSPAPTGILLLGWGLCTAWFLFAALVISIAFGSAAALYLWSVPALPLFVITALIVMPHQSKFRAAMLVGAWLLFLLLPPSTSEVVLDQSQFRNVGPVWRYLATWGLAAIVTSVAVNWLLLARRAQAPPDAGHVP